jgi:methionine-rich copper-binding protein CopC
MTRRPRAVLHRAVPARPEPRRRAARSAAALAAATLLAVVSAVAGAAPASAHDRLTGSTPKDGSTVTTAPTEVELTFTDEVQELGLTVLVKDPSGASVADGKPSIDGDTVVQKLDALTASGVYTVAYRVVSSDGHPISGRFTFTASLAAASPSASPTESASSTSSPSATPTSASPSASAASVAASPVASTSDAGSSTPWVLVGVLVLAALVGTGIALARRRSA